MASIAPSFAERFCARHGLSPGAYGEAVLRRALYPHARGVYCALACLSENYGRADRDFIHGVGMIRRLQDFSGEAADYMDHPANRGFLRRRLRLRVSSRRLRRLAEEAFSMEAVPTEIDSQVPWPNTEPNRSV